MTHVAIEEELDGNWRLDGKGQPMNNTKAV
jgi:hypothetical protein